MRISVSRPAAILVAIMLGASLFAQPPGGGQGERNRQGQERPGGQRPQGGPPARQEIVYDQNFWNNPTPETVFSIEKGKLTLTLPDSLIAKKGAGSVDVYRSEGRLAPKKKVGSTSSKTFVDNVSGNPYLYYYTIEDASGNVLGTYSPHEDLLGQWVIEYNPADDAAKVGEEINAIWEKMWRAEMSPYRYAVLLRPGDYKDAGLLKIPFYMEISGLGATPYDVKVSNIHTPPHLNGGNGTCTFWRSAENLSVEGPETYDEPETFKWAVSQAAPLRRIHSTRTLRTQWENGWVSGGFAADCDFEAPAGSDHQQQWYYRNSVLGKGRGTFIEEKYNYCFQGVVLGPTVDKSTYTDNWDKGGNVTFIETTPVIREKPFLFVDNDGAYKVFRPALRMDSKGLSYTRTSIGEGTVIDLLEDFFIVKPGMGAKKMNEALTLGKHLLITPGMYQLEEPIHVTKPGTIVLGLGFATLVPGESNPETAILVDDVPGVSISSLMFDAHYSSETLIKVGDGHSSVRHDADPTVLSDLFFRIGGFRAAPVHVDRALEINSNDVIGDHFWIWRADHGTRGSVGWDVNTSRNGLVVNGDHVTVYGLFNEHFQEYQTLWCGEYGRTYFFQCESPYDSPNQEAYMSENGTKDGYAAYKVADNVQNHFATAFGIYDVLTREIRIESSVEVPENPGIRLHNICNNSLSSPPNRGYGFVVNHLVKSTYNTFRDNRTYLVDFPAKQ